MFREAFSLLCKLNTASSSSEAWIPNLENLSMSVSKFEDLNATIGSTKSITSFFKKKEELDNCDVEKKESIIKCYDDEVPYLMDDEGGTKKLTDKFSDTGIKSFFKVTESLDQSYSLTESGDTTVQHETVGKSDQPQDSANDISENVEDFDIAELIPSLEAYDESILELLPLNLRSKAKERVKQLRSKPSATGISRFLVKDRGSTHNEKKNMLAMVDNKENSVVNDLQSTNQAELSTNENNDPKEQAEFISCDQCSKRVSPFELPEHLDFHYALSLNQEISGNNDRRNSLAGDVGGKSQSASGQKRKRKDGSDKADNKKQSKDISVFFNKQ